MQKDLDKDWDAYVAEFDNIGLERYIELVKMNIDTGKTRMIMCIGYFKPVPPA